MRPTDHSLFQDMYISSFGSGTKHDEEKTGWGWKTVGVIKAQDTLIPTTLHDGRAELIEPRHSV